MTSLVRFESRPDSIDVVLNRPTEGNLITNEMGQEIARTLRDIGPEVKLIRLRGEGANFCKGRQAPQIDREKATALDLRHPVAEVPLALYQAVKEARAPTLAIVQGEALFRFRNIATGEAHEIKTSSSEPTVIETIPGWAHDVTNIGKNEMVALLLANEIFDRQRSDTIEAML